MNGKQSPNGAQGKKKGARKNRRKNKHENCSQQSPNDTNGNSVTVSDDAPKPTEEVKVNSRDECLPKFSVNMIPEFDPSNEESNIDNFLLKVNECAEKFHWNDEETTRYALPKLIGGAKVWLQNEISVSHGWARWQDLLRKAFPYNLEYPELLGAMLDRHLKLGDDLEEYYSDKMALLYPCGIDGKKAVDCIIHGIEDFNLKNVATAEQCAEPIELLNLLKDVYYEQGHSGGWCV